MAVLIKRFYVRHNGKKYGPGEILNNLSEEEEANLINGSGGYIEKYTYPRSSQDTEEDGGALGGDALIDVDFDELVKPVGGDGKNEP